jgi:hypothetical protein
MTIHAGVVVDGKETLGEIPVGGADALVVGASLIDHAARFSSDPELSAIARRFVSALMPIARAVRIAPEATITRN